MEQEKRWIELDDEQLQKLHVEERNIRGVTVAVQISPYDVPLAVTGRPEGGRFVIEFKYITEDEKTREQKDDHLWLHVGKNSGRIYAIEIDVEALQAQHVRLEMVGDAIDKMALLKEHEERRGNYLVTKHIIRTRAREILEPLEAVS